MHEAAKVNSFREPKNQSGNFEPKILDGNEGYTNEPAANDDGAFDEPQERKLVVATDNGDVTPEYQNRVDNIPDTPAASSINDLRQQLDNINYQAGQGLMDDDEASRITADLEKQLYELELKQSDSELDSDVNNVPVSGSLDTAGNEQASGSTEEVLLAPASEAVEEEKSAFELRREFNAARDNYHATLETSYKNRSMFSRSFNWVKDKGSQVVDVFREDKPGSVDSEQTQIKKPLPGESLSKEAQEYYNNLPFWRRVFGPKRDEMNPDVLAAKENFDAKNQALYEYKKKNVYPGVMQKGLEKGYDISFGIANRHVLRPAGQRQELQSAHLPENLKNAKDRLGQFMQNHRKKVLAATFMISALNPLRAGAVLTAGMIGKLYIKSKADAEAANKKEIVGGIMADHSGRLVELENAYYKDLRALKAAQIRTRIAVGATGLVAGGSIGAEAYADVSSYVNKLTDGAGINGAIDGISDAIDKFSGGDGGGGGEGGGINSWSGKISAVADSAPDTPEAEVINPDFDNNVLRQQTEAEIEHQLRELAPSEQIESVVKVDPLDSSIGPKDAFNIDKPSLDTGVDLSPKEGLDQQLSAEHVSPTESLSPEKIVHHVERGQNLSTEFSDKVRELTDTQDYRLPPGVSRDEIVHKMYQTFPEMTKAHGVPPAWTPQDWRDVGVSSGNPNLIYPTDNINMSAMMAKMGVLPNSSGIDVSSAADSAFSGHHQPVHVAPHSAVSHQSLEAISNLNKRPLDFDHLMKGPEVFDLNYTGQEQVPDNLPSDDAMFSGSEKSGAYDAEKAKYDSFREAGASVETNYPPKPVSDGVPYSPRETSTETAGVPDREIKHFNVSNDGHEVTKSTYSVRTNVDGSTGNVSGSYSHQTGRLVEGTDNFFPDTGAMTQNGQVIVSEPYANIEYRATSAADFNQELSKVVYEGHKSGDLRILNNETGKEIATLGNSVAYVKSRLDDLMSPKDGEPPLLSPEVLKQYGITDGEFAKVKEGDVVDMGGIVKEILKVRTPLP